LDPNKLFFQQKDIDQFEHYRNTLGDITKKGDVTPCSEIFKVFFTRAESRLRKTIAELPQTVSNIDLSKSDVIHLDYDSKCWAKSSAEADTLWLKQNKLDILQCKLTGLGQNEIILRLSQRYKSQLKQLIELDQEVLFNIYINSLTEAYGGRTCYISTQEMKRLSGETSTDVVGLGLSLQLDNNIAKVVRTIDGGPADKTRQVYPGDLIVGITEGSSGHIQDIIGWQLQDIIKLTRGPIGSVACLEILPYIATHIGEHRKVCIVRDRIKDGADHATLNVQTILHNKQTYMVGIIKLPAFYTDFESGHNSNAQSKSSISDISRLLKEATEKGAKYIVLDLCDNAGGYLPEATGLISLFIQSGVPVQVMDRNGHVENIATRHRDDFYYSGPLAVLINGRSSSSAEIVAGALQDYRRAIIVGAPSCGHGEVETMQFFFGGLLKVTSSMFYRISGKAVHKNGIVPDIEFPFVGNNSNTVMKNNLPSSNIAEIPHTTYNSYPLIIERLRELHIKRTSNDPDFIYAKEMSDFTDEQERISTLSLSETFKNKQEQANVERVLAIETKRQQKKNLPVKPNGVMPFVYDGLNEAYVTEAARILLDSVDLLNLASQKR